MVKWELGFVKEKKIFNTISTYFFSRSMLPAMQSDFSEQWTQEHYEELCEVKLFFVFYSHFANRKISI